MILVSVVIPTMNRAALLERCLAALAREVGSAQDIEIIVADDGSSAATVLRNQALCKQYNAEFVGSDGHHGMAVTRNRGSCRAQGEWLVFLDDDVAVDDGWYPALTELLPGLNAGAVAFEGRVNPSGSGVWDREVSNLKGSAFLTCHIGVRTTEFRRLGGFDTAFEFKGPFCEDHEFAARLLLWGNIPFFYVLSVTHAPRTVGLRRFIFSAPRRCRGLLRAEQYFHTQHPDRYHRFRAHRNFAGTLRNVLLRNVVDDLRRRSVLVLLAHPLQTAALIIGSIVEQATAWLMLPEIIAEIRSSTGFARIIDRDRTAAVWSIVPEELCRLRVKRDIFASLLFSVTRRPAYNISHAIRLAYPAISGEQQNKIYFRIDDVTLDDGAAVEKLCTLFRDRSMPFLAAITGNDLCIEAHRPLIEMIRASGGEIGIHGFNHTGTFGPYASELLQMSIPEILSRIDTIRRTGFFNGKHPLILVPPYNAIGPLQIGALARHFAIITGGPETVRFTDRYIGPIAIREGGWYFPSLHPFYGSARSIVKHVPLTPIPVPVCLSTHLIDETRNRFVDLARLLDKLPMGTRKWDGVF